jgi:O-antigen/teichoic acid export membrane protein
MQHLSIFEAAQLAFQNQYKFNVATTIGTFMAAIAVYIVARYSASVLSILMAAHLPILWMRYLNAIQVWLELRPKIYWPIANSWVHMQSLIRDGIHFVSGSSVSNFLCHPFSILIFGAFSSALSTAAFAAVMNAIILAASVFGLIMTPFRGALPEAKQREDMSWIRRVYVLVLVFNVCYGIAICMLFTIVGDWLFLVWYNGAVSPNRLLLGAAGLYVLCLAVEVTNYNFLASLGQVRSASKWMLGKGIASALILFGMAATELMDYIMWGLVAANVFFSLIPLTVRTTVLLRNDNGTVSV